MEKLQQWQKIKEIVGSALERPPDERSAYLDEVCSQDSALRAEVESLLAAHRDAEGLSDITWSITALPTQEIPPARFVPGMLLSNRYRIVTPVGQGGMGELYRAEDLRLGQTVALKFLPKTIAHIPDAWAQVEREVRTARQISHPNVCRVFDIGESNDGPFITMEFIDGEDLASLLKRIGRLHTDKGLQVAHQLCTGLAAAHELGIVHRDLKPATSWWMAAGGSALLILASPRWSRNCARTKCAQGRPVTWRRNKSPAGKSRHAPTSTRQVS